MSARTPRGRHWTDADFVVTSTSVPGTMRHDQVTPYPVDAASALNQHGYCGVCFCDMARFGRDRKSLHYSSHDAAIQLGLWGKKRANPPPASYGYAGTRMAPS